MLLSIFERLSCEAEEAGFPVKAPAYSLDAFLGRKLCLRNEPEYEAVPLVFDYLRDVMHAETASGKSVSVPFAELDRWEFASRRAETKETKAPPPIKTVRVPSLPRK